MSDSLAVLLKDRIRRSGPLSVADYMAACLADPHHGYYMRRDPLGAAGDFITAPEISQMFGELIGLWAAVVWQSMGEPAELVVAELGPGRGTLMADFLRAARQVPAFRQAVRVHLVETSPALRRRQRETLADTPAVWLERIEDLPAGPLLVVANEFFDALPISQYVKRRDGWHERLIALDGDAFAFADGPLAAIAAPPAEGGDIFEINWPARGIAQTLGNRLATEGGAALIIDYGHPFSAAGDTFQAVRQHKPAPVLDAPGLADLTAHVDFQALAEAARPARSTRPVTQGQLLRALGIDMRAERLAAVAPDKAEDISLAYRRLIDPQGMGNLFKAIALIHPQLPTPPGFPS
jgi:NADH dehydrogenase [ubiquinone] 1 alpha subcomplex assembly factor 7